MCTLCDNTHARQSALCVMYAFFCYGCFSIMTVKSVGNSQINTTLNGSRGNIYHTFLFVCLFADKRMNREFYNRMKIVYYAGCCCCCCGLQTHKLDIFVSLTFPTFIHSFNSTFRSLFIRHLFVRMPLLCAISIEGFCIHIIYVLFQVVNVEKLIFYIIICANIVIRFDFLITHRHTQR